MSTTVWDYPEDIVALREGVTGFLKKEVIPAHEKYAGTLEHSHTPEGRYTPDTLAIISEIRQKAADAGYYTVCVPEELGGAGFGYLANFAIWERIHHLCGAQYWLGHSVVSHWVRGPSPVLRKIQAPLLEEVLPDVMAGRATLCFGLSEPGAGSDAAMIKTKAKPDGDGWRLSGSKIWTTNAPYADYSVVFAVTDAELAEKRNGGISAFFVPTNSPGFNVERLIKMWGEQGAEEAEIRLDDVYVEPHQLIGELNKGFDIAMLGVGLGRMYNCGRAIGFARWALEMGLDYVQVRKTFGRPISEYQGVTFPLADSAMAVHAAHLVSRNAAMMLDAGHRAQKELSMAKVLSVEAGCDAVDQVMQVHGALGFTNEMYLTRAYKALRNVRIADGSGEIMRRQIAKRLLSGDLEL